VAHLVEVLVVKCCTKWFLMTDHLSSWTVLFIITTWLQCAELGGMEGMKRKGGSGREEAGNGRQGGGESGGGESGGDTYKQLVS